MSKKQPLYLRRAQPMHPRTRWRPISHVEMNGERLRDDQLRDHLLSGSMSEKPIKVESPYDRGKFVGKFVVEPLTLIVRHKETKGLPYSMYLHEHPLAVIWPHVRIAEGVEIGQRSEIRQYARIDRDSQIGERAVVDKQTHIGSDAAVGSAVFVGNYSRLADNVKVGLGTRVEKETLIGLDAHVGMQVRLERGTYIGANTFIDDGAEIGRSVRIREDVVIGERASISHYTVVGAGAIIGAEAVVGEQACLMPTAWVRAGEHVPGRAESLQTQFGN